MGKFTLVTDYKKDPDGVVRGKVRDKDGLLSQTHFLGIGTPNNDPLILGRLYWHEKGTNNLEEIPRSMPPVEGLRGRSVGPSSRTSNDRLEGARRRPSRSRSPLTEDDEELPLSSPSTAEKNFVISTSNKNRNTRGAETRGGRPVEIKSLPIRSATGIDQVAERPLMGTSPYNAHLDQLDSTMGRTALNQEPRVTNHVGEGSAPSQQNMLASPLARLNLPSDVLDFIKLPINRFRGILTFLSDHPRFLRSGQIPMFDDAAVEAMVAGDLVLMQQCIQRRIIATQCMKSAGYDPNYLKCLIQNDPIVGKHFYDSVNQFVLSTKMKAAARKTNKLGSLSQTLGYVQVNTAMNPAISYPHTAATQPTARSPGNAVPETRYPVVPGPFEADGNDRYGTSLPYPSSANVPVSALQPQISAAPMHAAAWSGDNGRDDYHDDQPGHYLPQMGNINSGSVRTYRQGGERQPQHREPGDTDRGVGRSGPPASHNSPQPGPNNPQPGYNHPQPGYNHPQSGYNHPQMPHREPGDTDRQPTYADHQQGQSNPHYNQLSARTYASTSSDQGLRRDSQPTATVTSNPQRDEDYFSGITRQAVSKSTRVSGRQFEDPEKLDRRFKLQDGKTFFTQGRVFMMMYPEPKGKNPKSSDILDTGPDSSLSVIKDRYKQDVFTHEKRFVVIRWREGYCLCVPINSYRDSGVAKKGMQRREKAAHAIIYDNSKRPTMPILPGEEDIVKKPIAVDMIGSHTLTKTSRIHFAKIYTIEWNVKVMAIGKIADKSTDLVEEYWRKELIYGES
ncbi:hypothetical protein LTR84_002988 [Exophiala bonariae]|uniref:DUF6590 domain-containing protein n=1 Tax=Exophiala bonariae TaxID=1690606 RepID=A0AAV9N7U3_9EURO|nr:hypothetical protein LTR84_002988 [Exophiala bonariae]